MVLFEQPNEIPQPEPEPEPESEGNGCTRGGVNCATKIKAQIKPTQDLYWFGLPDLRPVLNHPGRVPLSLRF